MSTRRRLVHRLDTVEVTWASAWKVAVAVIILQFILCLLIYGLMFAALGAAMISGI